MCRTDHFPSSEPERVHLPLDENGENEDGEVYLYRYYEENGQPNLDNIDSDEEYEIAADAFDELMDTEQFNEMEENSTEE